VLKGLLAVILAIGVPPKPIIPVPLRILYADAELVVVARAGKTVEWPARVDVFKGSVTLTVEKAVKGKADAPEIHVITARGLI